jgi:hypothetical protein
MTCVCGKVLCMKHYVPNKHNCERILKKEEPLKEEQLVATGAFQKIEKI